MNNLYSEEKPEIKENSAARTAKYLLACAAWIALFGFAIFEMI